MNLLSVVRLSDLTDESTSPERQKARNQGYADDHDHKIIGVAEDLDVSGAVSPFARKGLGPWLTDEHLTEWDALIVAKLDRLTRSLGHFLALVAWLNARGKALISIEPSIDLTTPHGRMFAEMMVRFGQFEREMTAGRVKDAYDSNRAMSKYTGGSQISFGYRPVRLQPKGWGFEPDPRYAPVVQEMARKYLGLESLNMIAKWLNEEGVPTPRDAIRIRNGKKPSRIRPEWRGNKVRQILESSAILGAMTTREPLRDKEGKVTLDKEGKVIYGKREPLRDKEGKVIYRADGLVTRQQYDAIQARIASNPGRGSARVNSSPLLHVALCGECGDILYINSTGKRDRKGGKYAYYLCKTAAVRDGRCKDRNIRADILEQCLEEVLLEEVGTVEVIEDQFVKGYDYSEEIRRLGEQASHLWQKVVIGRAAKQDVTTDERILEEAQAELERLVALEPVPDSFTTVETGEMFAERWEKLDSLQRNEFLRNAGVKVHVKHWEPPQIAGAPDQMDFRWPDRTVVVRTRDGLLIQVNLGKFAELRELAGKKVNVAGQGAA